MRIFITGGLGFVGIELAKYLCSRHDIFIYDKNYYSLSTASIKNDAFQISIGDIRDERSLFREMRSFCPDVIVHLAALSNDVSGEIEEAEDPPLGGLAR